MRLDKLGAMLAERGLSLAIHADVRLPVPYRRGAPFAVVLWPADDPVQTIAREGFELVEVVREVLDSWDQPSPGRGDPLPMVAGMIKFPKPGARDAEDQPPRSVIADWNAARLVQFTALTYRVIAGIEVALLEPERARVIVSELHDQCVAVLNLDTATTETVGDQKNG